MTVLRSQGLVPTKLILDSSTVALSLPFDVELVIVLVDTVWLAEFPLVFLPVCAVTSLVLVSLPLFRHD